MIELNIPGKGIIQLDHLVCDVNGTVAVDGILPTGLPGKIQQLKDRLCIHLLTADTHGKQKTIDQELGLTASILKPGPGGAQKAAYVRQLGAKNVICIGQGSNDAEMLKEAAIGICLISSEGLSTDALLSADILMPDIFSALELLNKPMRLVATLRK